MSDIKCIHHNDPETCLRCNALKDFDPEANKPKEVAYYITFVINHRKGQIMRDRVITGGHPVIWLAYQRALAIREFGPDAQMLLVFWEQIPDDVLEQLKAMGDESEAGGKN